MKKYPKLVHNRCARCNLCNLNNADVGNVDIVDNIDIKLEQSYFDGFSNMDTIVSQSDETHYLESTSKISPSPPLPASVYDSNLCASGILSSCLHTLPCWNVFCYFCIFLCIFFIFASLFICASFLIVHLFYLCIFFICASFLFVHLFYFCIFFICASFLFMYLFFFSLQSMTF